MTDRQPERIKIGELADRAGVSRRTIRFYIARDLLPPPLRVGRGAVYGPEHLERLQRIRDLQEEGLTLREIGRVLAGADAEQAALAPSPWWRHSVADDVTVLVKADIAPWRARQIQRAVGRLTSELMEDGKEDSE